MAAGQTYSVLLGEPPVEVGELRSTLVRSKETAHFRYADSWLNNPSAFALSPSLPLSDQWRYFSESPDNRRLALPGVVRDAAPDAWGRSIIQRSVGARTEMEFLLAVDDRTRLGALRFTDSKGVPLSANEPPVPRLTDLRRLHTLCAALETGSADPRVIARDLKGASASLGGARPKSVVVDDRGIMYLAKFTMSGDSRPVERVEVATLTLAAEAGLHVPLARLADPDSIHPVALIERFDRAAGADRRVHYMSAQTLLDSPRGDSRYYTDIADSLRTVCRNGEKAVSEMKELHRRILYTILVTNTDDHLKNHGLLYDPENGWGLSPAFDINPQPYRHAQLKTGISELSGYEPSVEAWIEAAPFFEVSEDAARETAADMATIIAGRWRDLFRNNGVTEPQCDEYATAFEHDRMDVALAAANRRIQPTARSRSSEQEAAGRGR